MNPDFAPGPRRLAHLSERLAGTSDTPALDAQVLLAHIAGQTRSWILAHPEMELTARQADALGQALARLERGEPLPYVLGHWEFYGLDLVVTPDVLIPRPETEMMVEEALAWLRTHPGRRLAADAGTGSGAIALALAHDTGDLRVWAGDLSFPALRVAQENVARHGLSRRIGLFQGDLLTALSGPLDLICANLPYIPDPTLRSLAVYGREPELALSGGEDGLDVIRRFLGQAALRLASGGLLLCEIEATQGEAAIRLAESAFPTARVSLLRDLAGKDRLVRVEQEEKG